ncbi:hypothetical protein Leryth_000359 [Lithospermum erythrorhizon]|nr:hypothetical protein Leryth_000359 [Lithospermum erythrorhizon]
MENHLVSQNKSRDPQACDRDGHIRESRRLGYQLKYESPQASRANISSKNVNDVKTFQSRSSELLKKQQANEKVRGNEELVRYMSKLPGFLKKDVKLNEKAFSVGVLDWKQLEKWQHFQKIGNQHSSASSDISSFSSSGGSSSNSSRTHSLPPAQHKLGYPTLQSHFYGTPFENYNRGTESLDVNKLKAQDRKAAPIGFPGVHQTTLSTHLPSDQKPEYGLRDCKVKDKKVVKSAMVRESQSFEELKEKMKIQDSESLRRHHKMRTSTDHYTIDEVPARKQETPTYEHGNKYPQTRRSLKLTDTKVFGSNKAGHLSVPSAIIEASCTKLACDMPHSCPREADASNPLIEEPCSGASQDNKISNDLFRLSSDSRDVPVNNNKGKKLQGEKSIPAVKDRFLINSVNPPMSSKTKSGSSGTPKVRNPSPTRRFSFSLPRVGKASSSGPTSTVLQLSARNSIGSSGAEEACISSSSLNNSKANGKGRSSPLRRLLDPLMRPARASVSDSRSSEPASKSAEGHGESTSHSVKVNSDLKTSRSGDAEVPHCSSKSPTVRALLQVAVRNGFPLFTFAVDNKNDILAATMRKSSSGKEEFSYIYSFFTVQEMKKKSGNWINHGRKDNGNNFVHNIVAQMKVTSASKQNLLDQSILKEYVLFSYDAKQAETSDLEQNEELAAVVVKLSKKSSRCLCQNWQGYENFDDSASKLKQTHPLSSFKRNSDSGNMEGNRTEDQLTMTVLLPGGHHGQPIKGEPSTLVKRWQSGGACDCGGWDLGCRMRVLTDNVQFHQRSSSAKPHHTSKLLELFSQGEGQDQKPVFSLAPFKDGIYAVEFNSSIEILQAFSISLSILSSLKVAEFVETSNGFKAKSSADVTVLETVAEKVYSRTQTRVPAFVSNPPLSPVGRV